jgi:hypothetical protein
MVPESIVELYIELYKSGVHCKDGQKFMSPDYDRGDQDLEHK